jgi:poly(A) polymerase
VVHTLKEAGYEAYIVGGAVRDLLLGLRPRTSTSPPSATPEQVKGAVPPRLHHRPALPHRHVVYGRGREHEVIEVSTFRAYMDSAGRRSP